MHGREAPYESNKLKQAHASMNQLSSPANQEKNVKASVVMHSSTCHITTKRIAAVVANILNVYFNKTM